ncbi:MAG: class I SAM-dependent methyltransferase [Pseudomonadales bacterium]|nr:class I SAM-dependent methyltransferase [Pseudomonadales bacterium]MCP5186009.1 class I SAM-dependent methyltransferase [Pseudomonadales bacterium]
MAQAATTNQSETLELNDIKRRQQAVWASGDYAQVGCTLQIVGENLAEALQLRAGERVLDVAAGNGNFTLAAARRFTRVTSTDYVAALLARGEQRATAEGYDITFQVADAEALPFADDSFDCVGSVFGAMFAPDQTRCGTELVRVCRPGGRIGMANWTPDGFIGRLFRVVGSHVKSAVPSPALWGTQAHLRQIFADCTTLEIQRRHFNFLYRSTYAWLENFKTIYGPVRNAFLQVEPARRDALQTDLLALLDELNVAADGTMVVPAEYLQVVATR